MARLSIRPLHLAVLALLPLLSSSLSLGTGLRDWQRLRARETADALDASRYHLQILFVDEGDGKGRIAEGLLARVGEWNDAVNILFPASTSVCDPSKPVDVRPNAEAVAVCASLELCASRSKAEGSYFDMSYLESYDLVVALNDDIRQLIMRSLPSEADQTYYGPKCRLLSEFLSCDFTGGGRRENLAESLPAWLDEDLYQRVRPFIPHVDGASSEVFRAAPSASAPALVLLRSDDEGLGQDQSRRNQKETEEEEEEEEETPGAATAAKAVYAAPNLEDAWPKAEAAMVVAAAGLARFCLETIDESFAQDFATLLDTYFCRAEHLDLPWPEADARLRHSTISGYFSPEERKRRFDAHMTALTQRLAGAGSSSSSASSPS